MAKTHKILLLCSGGDASGMNAAIRAVVRTARSNNIEIHGCTGGYSGLIAKDIKRLSARDVGDIIQIGGTILKTDRCPSFTRPAVRQQCLDYLIQHDFTGMIVLGGDGSFRGAQLLTENSPIQLIGIPCTIDNDIPGTEYTLGFDTAVNNAVAAIDNIRDTAMSHDRNFLVEVMGRNTGFIASDVGIAAGAEIILTPEHPITTEELIQQIKNRKNGKAEHIIVVAEADQPGHSMQLAQEIHSLCGIEYKFCILGHTQRGGKPSAKDRVMGSIMGYTAVNALLDNQSQKMTAVINGVVDMTSFPSPDNATRFLSDTQLIKINTTLSQT